MCSEFWWHRLLFAEMLIEIKEHREAARDKESNRIEYVYWSDFDLHQDRDTCPTSSGSSQVDNKTYQQTTSAGPEEKSEHFFEDHLSWARGVWVSSRGSLQPGSRRSPSIFPTTTSAWVIHPDVELRWRHFADRRPRPPTSQPSVELYAFLIQYAAYNSTQMKTFCGPEASTSTQHRAQRRDFLIHRVRCTARSSPYFEHYNIPTPAQRVMDSSRYHSQQLRVWSEQLWRNPDVRIMQLWRPIISAPISYNTHDIYTLGSPSSSGIES